MQLSPQFVVSTQAAASRSTMGNERTVGPFFEKYHIFEVDVKSGGDGRVRFKMGALFAFLTDSSRALQAYGQGTASAVQVAGERP